MRRPVNTFFLALCASTVVHAALMLVASRTTAIDIASHLTPPGPEHSPASRPVLFLPIETRWGEAGGRGVALNSTPGDRPLSAPKGIQDQAFASRDPIGPAEVLPPQPSMSTTPQGQGGNGQLRPQDTLAERIARFTPPAQIQAAQPLPAAAPEPPLMAPNPPLDLNTVEPIPPPAPPELKVPDVEPVAHTPTPAVTAAPVASVATSSTIGSPGSPTAAADPAADTGLESDPFSKTPGVEFRNGKVEARSGRQVKPVRPRLSEASRRDLLALRFPTVLLKVRIDDTGKVQDVRVLRGSGSEAIDMPVYRAMWQWWFEPPKDKEGKPLPDVQLVAIHWG